MEVRKEGWMCCATRSGMLCFRAVSYALFYSSLIFYYLSVSLWFLPCRVVSRAVLLIFVSDELLLISYLIVVGQL
ncbi:hypothetical protein B0H19DRAFT_1152491 [Mycena capillaripes]|nr:hypothetical protein B0H19DRAFT_1152491 [Mycena capillaripes]